MNLGEATAALLAVQLASLEGYSSLMLERDSLTSILAINNAKCSTEWNFSSVIVDIHYLFIFCSLCLNRLHLIFLRVPIIVHTTLPSGPFRITPCIRISR